jgi:hypothetical protein
MAFSVRLGDKANEDLIRNAVKRLTAKSGRWGIAVLPLIDGPYHVIGLVESAMFQNGKFEAKFGGGSIVEFSVSGSGKHHYNDDLKVIVNKRMAVVETVFFGDIANVLRSLTPIHLPACATYPPSPDSAMVKVVTDAFIKQQTANNQTTNQPNFGNPGGSGGGGVLSSANPPARSQPPITIPPLPLADKTDNDVLDNDLDEDGSETARRGRKENAGEGFSTVNIDELLATTGPVLDESSKPQQPETLPNLQTNSVDENQSSVNSDTSSQSSSEENDKPFLSASTIV